MRIIETFVGSPDKLLASLEESPAQTLLWSCWGLDRVRKADLGVPFDRWPDLANTMLDAAEMRPELVLPQIALMLTNEATLFPDEPGKGLSHRYSFDDGRATALFERLRLDALFREHSGMHVSGPAKEFYAACVRGIAGGAVTA